MQIQNGFRVVLAMTILAIGVLFFSPARNVLATVDAQSSYRSPITQLARMRHNQ